MNGMITIMYSVVVYPTKIFNNIATIMATIFQYTIRNRLHNCTNWLFINVYNIIVSILQQISYLRYYAIGSKWE